MDLSVSEYDQVAGCCEHGDEPSGSIKCDESDQLRNCQLFKNDTAAWSS